MTVPLPSASFSIFQIRQRREESSVSMPSVV